MNWYELHLEKDDNNTFLVTAPAFPEVTTFGDFERGIPEALQNGRNAIEEAIAARISAGDELPAPIRECNGLKYCIQVPLLTYIKSGLYMICRIEGVSRADLARRLGWHREQVDRLFRLDHNSRLDQIEAAFKALDISLDLGIPNFEPQAA